ncbi:MAG: PAS-domain containing protein [Paracoccaceae bacterium]
MALEHLVQLLGLAGLSLGAAVSALWALSRYGTHSKTRYPTGPADTIELLFEDENLINATEPGHRTLSAPMDDETDLQSFQRSLQNEFPDIVEKFCAMSNRDSFSFRSQDGASEITASTRDGLMRIRLCDAPEISAVEIPESGKYMAIEHELATLRAVAEFTPFLVWRQNASGTITWANNAYLALSQSNVGDQALSWPPTRLFDLGATSASDDTGQSVRVTTHIPGEAEPRWFECFESPLDGERLFTAVAADKVVKAEIALRDFVQTLTKTFAHLTIGLAIFDKQRRLALFNPALTDLTTLPPDFLSGRPTLLAVLDRLRDKQMIPEPKDYKSWRRQLFELEAAAADGSYEETWALGTGQTFRVTGRPHPDGAVAFLFEDISAKVSLTRRYRSEMENGQSVLDAFDQGIAVFASSGRLMASNTAYSRLWGINPTAIMGEYGIIDASQIWATNCMPSPVWGDAREFVGTQFDRADWSAEVQQHDGQIIQCRFTPVSGGATLVRFSIKQLRTKSPASKLTVQHTQEPETALL